MMNDSFRIYLDIKKMLQEIEQARGLGDTEKKIKIADLRLHLGDLKNQFIRVRSKEGREALSQKEEKEQENTETVLKYLEEELDNL